MVLKVMRITVTYDLMVIRHTNLMTIDIIFGDIGIPTDGTYIHNVIGYTGISREIRVL